MKRINKNGEKNLDIKYIYKLNGIRLDEILKDGYLCYLRNLNEK